MAYRHSTKHESRKKSQNWTFDINSRDGEMCERSSSLSKETEMAGDSGLRDSKEWWTSTGLRGSWTR